MGTYRIRWEDAAGHERCDVLRAKSQADALAQLRRLRSFRKAEEAGVDVVVCELQDELARLTKVRNILTGNEYDAIIDPATDAVYPPNAIAPSGKIDKRCSAIGVLVSSARHLGTAPVFERATDPGPDGARALRARYLKLRADLHEAKLALAAEYGI